MKNETTRLNGVNNANYHSTTATDRTLTQANTAESIGPRTGDISSAVASILRPYEPVQLDSSLRIPTNRTPYLSNSAEFTPLLLVSAADRVWDDTNQPYSDPLAPTQDLEQGHHLPSSQQPTPKISNRTPTNNSRKEEVPSKPLVTMREAFIILCGVLGYANVIAAKIDNEEMSFGWVFAPVGATALALMTNDWCERAEKTQKNDPPHRVQFNSAAHPNHSKRSFSDSTRSIADFTAIYSGLSTEQQAALDRSPLTHQMKALGFNPK